MNDTSTQYRIEYTLQRRQPGDDDFTDIGFGSSGGWESPRECAHMVASDIDNNAWETQRGMPEPESIGREGRDDDD